MNTYVFRLKPGQKLREEIDKFVEEKNIKAGIVLTCVGNLSKAVLRMADASIVKNYEGTFEIVSLVGTAEKGNSHLHISISDKDGHAFGGHLKNGSIIGITAEVVIGELDGLSFKREFDKNTGYDELIIEE
ncbi:MAG TPA: PPC domain-containing DNA-binding protein [Mariniflexile sp.]